MKLNKAEYLLEEGPPSAFYIPDFITESEEQLLLKKVASAPIPRWTQLSNRRLQNWGGLPHPRGMISEAIPDWLQKHMNEITTLDIFGEKAPNHVLVNEYLPGQGIMPHLDGSLFHPTISTINLGSHTVLNFYEPLPESVVNGPGYSIHNPNPIAFKDRLKFSLVLQPRSLLILQDECYSKYLHGIEEVKEDKLSNCGKILNLKAAQVSIDDCLKRETRVSLTIRYVPRAAKGIIKLGK